MANILSLPQIELVFCLSFLLCIRVINFDLLLHIVGSLQNMNLGCILQNLLIQTYVTRSCRILDGMVLSSSVLLENHNAFSHLTLDANNNKQNPMSFSSFILFYLKMLKWDQLHYCGNTDELLLLLAIFLHLLSGSLFCSDKVKVVFPHKDNKTNSSFSEQVMRLNSGLT